MARKVLKPKVCANCKKTPPQDLANISGNYEDNPSDWEWLCRRCHMIKDGRMTLFIKQGIENSKNKEIKVNTTSGFLGVSFHKPSGKWTARTQSNYKRTWLGSFNTKEEAAEAYRKAIYGTS